MNAELVSSNRGFGLAKKVRGAIGRDKVDKGFNLAFLVNRRGGGNRGTRRGDRRGVSPNGGTLENTGAPGRVLRSCAGEPSKRGESEKMREEKMEPSSGERDRASSSPNPEN